jgi:hypothetical protein
LAWVLAWMALPRVAAACDPSKGDCPPAQTDAPPASGRLTVAVHEDGTEHVGVSTLVVATRADPSKSAHLAKLVGPVNCTWTTGMMAQRVVVEGEPWTFVGRLTSSRNDLWSRVAAPYTIGPPGAGAIHVLANEVLEALEQRGATTERLELHGHLLEVDGIRYFVID